MNKPIGTTKWIYGIVTMLLLLSVGIAHSQTGAGKQVLSMVTDSPMPGPAVRFDYQSLDVEHGRLYISHMNANRLVVFDTQKREVVANLDGFSRVHGVIAVPEIGRDYASATGDHEVAVVDMTTLKTIATAGPINYPDGLAYSPAAKRVFVSDEHGGVDAVIDTTTNKLIAKIPLGGGAGNTVYDATSGHILVAVHGVNEIVSIDPAAMKIIGRYKLPGSENPYGIALDEAVDWLSLPGRKATPIESDLSSKSARFQRTSVRRKDNSRIDASRTNRSSTMMYARRRG